jgi:hypothetical protein
MARKPAEPALVDRQIDPTLNWADEMASNAPADSDQEDVAEYTASDAPVNSDREDDAANSDKASIVSWLSEIKPIGTAKAPADVTRAPSKIPEGQKSRTDIEDAEMTDAPAVTEALRVAAKTSSEAQSQEVAASAVQPNSAQSATVVAAPLGDHQAQSSTRVQMTSWKEWKAAGNPDCEDCKSVGLAGHHSGPCDPARRAKAVETKQRKQKESADKKAARDAEKAERDAKKAAAKAERDAAEAERDAEKAQRRTVSTDNTTRKAQRQQADQPRPATTPAVAQPTTKDSGAVTATESDAAAGAADQETGEAPAVPQTKANAAPKGDKQKTGWKGKGAHGRGEQTAPRCSRCNQFGHLLHQCNMPLCPSCGKLHRGGCASRLPKTEFQQRLDRMMDLASKSKTAFEADAWSTRIKALCDSQAVEEPQTGSKRRARSPDEGSAAKRHKDKDASESRRDRRRQ